MTAIEQAEKNLADYVATLSPERQAWANQLRAELDAMPKMEDRLAYIVKGISDAFSQYQSIVAVEHVATR